MPIISRSSLDSVSTGSMSILLFARAAKQTLEVVTNSAETMVATYRGSRNQMGESWRKIRASNYESKIKGLDEAYIRENLGAIVEADFRDILTLYEVGKKKGLYHNTSNQSEELKNRVLTAKDAKERAKLIIDYVFNKENYGRTLAQIILDHIKNLLLKGNTMLVSSDKKLKCD